MANNEKGIIYYKLNSKYEGDFTKNCGLKGEEIDGNFHFLRGYDIKEMAFDKETQTLTIIRLNGEKVEVDLGLELRGYTFDYDAENGQLIITPSVGPKVVLEGFLGQVSKDFTLDGDGTKDLPLRVANIAKTGTYRPANAFIDLTDEANNLPTDNLHKNERYVTKERLSKFGKLYPLSGVLKIDERLKEVGTGWRVPTKADWDEMLNVIECEEHRNHDDRRSNVDLGEKAGYMLKSNEFWKPSFDKVEEGEGDFILTEDGKFIPAENGDYVLKVHSCDAYGFGIYPVGFGGRRGLSSIGGFGEWAAYWTSTEEDTRKDMFVKVFENTKDTVEQNTWGEDCYLSLRLVKDFNGVNFHDTEVIDGQTYSCVHIENPDTREGSNLIWTKENVSFTNTQYKGVNSWEWKEAGEESFKTVYFVNDWNGFGWDKHELHEGESIVLFESPENPESRMHEWRLVDGVLVDTAALIKDEFKKVLEEIDKRITELNDKVNIEIDTRKEQYNELRNDINLEIDTRKEQYTELRNDINLEIDKRSEQYIELTDKINTEIEVRSEQYVELTDKINAEIDTRTEQYNELRNDLNSEIDTRTEQYEELRNDLNSEIDTRKKQYEELRNDLNSEIDTRTEQYEELRNDLNAEIDVRKEQYEELRNDLNVETDTRKEQYNELRNDLNAEIDKRTEQYNELRNDLNSEIDKRTKQYEELRNDLNTEIDTRKKQYEELRNDLNAEIDERKKVDADLQRQITENKVINEPNETSLVITPGKTNEEGVTTNTTIKVNIPSDTKEELPNHIRVDENGLYFDGFFGTF